MRRLFRPELTSQATKFLAKQSADGTKWATAQQRPQMKVVRKKLEDMAGLGARCMYCVDSHGSDIEHFWPKTPYPERMYDWKNLLLCCTECGRFKGTQFPLFDGTPLLVDPSAEDPWLHLDFTPQTGVLTARFDRQAGDFSAKGRATVDVLRLDEREALQNVYRRTYRRLVGILERFPEDGMRTAAELARALKKTDDHGLLGWWLTGTGVHDAPVEEFRKTHTLIWGECVSLLLEY